jgi:hypothetical protein
MRVHSLAAISFFCLLLSHAKVITSPEQSKEGHTTDPWGRGSALTSCWVRKLLPALTVEVVMQLYTVTKIHQTGACMAYKSNLNKNEMD